MLHRTVIRELAVRLLRENSEVRRLVGTNIKDSKATPFEGPGLPGINVVTPNQNATGRSMNIYTVDTTLKLNIEVYVQAMDGYQRKADEIAEAVENALLCNAEFQAVVPQLQTFDVENSIYDQGAKPIVVQILSLGLQFSEQWDVSPEDNLQQIDIGIDVIEPIANPAPGPDGREEFHLNIQSNQ